MFLSPPPSVLFFFFFLGLSDVCLRGLKCTKRGSLEKRGGLSLKKIEGLWGYSTRKKRGGETRKRGWGRANFQGGRGPLTYFNGIALIGEMLTGSEIPQLLIKVCSRSKVENKVKGQGQMPVCNGRYQSLSFA